MHPKNRHHDRYQLKQLSLTSPGLLPFITVNKYGDETIDFANPLAVKSLNQALLKFFYDINYWDIPDHNLCPPIPGRADYIHSAADLFEQKKHLKVLDIGTGANCIYPLLGYKEYHWKFVGTDIDKQSLANANNIVRKNELTSFIELRHQPDAKSTLRNIILPNEFFDLVICNPPFHESLEEAVSGSKRKWKNLGKSSPKTVLNFGGKGAELWCPGGERAFILSLIQESSEYCNQVNWFTCLVSKEKSLFTLQKALSKLHPAQVKIIEMSQGQKKSRLIAWKFDHPTK